MFYRSIFLFVETVFLIQNFIFSDFLLRTGSVVFHPIKYSETNFTNHYSHVDLCNRKILVPCRTGRLSSRGRDYNDVLKINYYCITVWFWNHKGTQRQGKCTICKTYAGCSCSISDSSEASSMSSKLSMILPDTSSRRSERPLEATCLAIWRISRRGSGRDARTPRAGDPPLSPRIGAICW